MAGPTPWVTDANAALLTDLYELTMLRAYWADAMFEPAVFSLFVRRLPPTRNYLVACGLDDALRYLEQLHFPPEAIAFLRAREEFPPPFLDWLAGLRFRGDVWAVPEGTPIFAEEPLLEVVASLPEAQLPETFLMNQVHLQTVLASKAARVVHAAGDRAVVDFGLRRTQGTDAGLKAARAFHVAGVAATSNVLAGQVYGVPLAGTMAHSYVQAHHSEAEAFRHFARLYPGSVLLVDTYDALEGVRCAIRLAAELGDDFRLGGVRLDSGDLLRLAREARRLLDNAGLQQAKIIASGGLDEYRIAELVAAQAPIDSFGIGSALGTSSDAPFIDFAYKLTEYDGRGRTKLSPGKVILPGRKQLYRHYKNGVFSHDRLCARDEAGDGEALLQPVMRGGRQLDPAVADIGLARERCGAALARLPPALRALDTATVAAELQVSEQLQRAAEQARRSACQSSYTHE